MGHSCHFIKPGYIKHWQHMLKSEIIPICIECGSLKAICQTLVVAITHLEIT